MVAGVRKGWTLAPSPQAGGGGGGYSRFQVTGQKSKPKKIPRASNKPNKIPGPKLNPPKNPMSNFRTIKISKGTTQPGYAGIIPGTITNL